MKDIKIILDIVRTKAAPEDIGVITKATVGGEPVCDYSLKWKIENGKCNLVSSEQASAFVTFLQTLCTIASLDLNDTVQRIQEVVESVDGMFCKTNDQTSLGTTVVYPLRRVITISEQPDCSLNKTFANSKDFEFLKTLHTSLGKIIDHDKPKVVQEITVDINLVSDDIKGFDFIDQNVEFPEVYKVFNLNYHIIYKDNSTFEGSYMFADSMTIDEDKMGPTFREEYKFLLFAQKSQLSHVTIEDFESLMVPYRPFSAMVTYSRPPENALLLVKNESSVSCRNEIFVEPERDKVVPMYVDAEPLENFFPKQN